MTRPLEAQRRTELGELPNAETVKTILAMAADELLSPEQARHELGLKSRQTIYNWLNDRDDPLPATKKGGWRIRRGDLAAYIERKSRKGKGEAPERRESDQTLRTYLSNVLTITQAALDYAHAVQVYNAAQSSMSFGPEVHITTQFAFIERCAEERTQKREQLLKVAGDMDEKTLQRLRFMLPSISSTISLESAPRVEGQESI